MLTVHAEDKRTLPIGSAQGGRRTDRSLGLCTTTWHRTLPCEEGSAGRGWGCLWQRTIREIRLTAIANFLLIKLVVVQIHVLSVVQLPGERRICRRRMLIVALRLLLVVEVLAVVVAVLLEHEIRFLWLPEGAPYRLLVVDYLLAVRVPDAILAGGPRDRVKVIETVVDIPRRGLFVVAAAGQRGRLCELSHESVRFEVTPEVGGCVGGSGGCCVIVANILIIRIILLLVVVRQVVGIHLAAATSWSTLEQRAT